MSAAVHPYPASSTPFIAGTTAKAIAGVGVAKHLGYNNHITNLFSRYCTQIDHYTGISSWKLPFAQAEELFESTSNAVEDLATEATHSATAEAAAEKTAEVTSSWGMPQFITEGWETLSGRAHELPEWLIPAFAAGSTFAVVSYATASRIQKPWVRNAVSALAGSVVAYGISYCGAGPTLSAKDAADYGALVLSALVATKVAARIGHAYIRPLTNAAVNIARWDISYSVKAKKA